MPETPDLFSMIDFHIDELFAPSDPALDAALAAARRNDLPEIQFSAGQGKFLYLLAKMIGVRRVLEIGTLGGYSTIWVARESIAKAALVAKVEIIVGPALETFPAVIRDADAPFDLVFLDADKIDYPRYIGLVMTRVRSGSLILADNVIRNDSVLAPRHDDPSAGAARVVNALLARHDRLEAILLQQVGVKGHDGIAIARVR